MDLLVNSFNPRPVITHGAIGANPNALARAYKFQSAPRDYSRGDSKNQVSKGDADKFQSAPRDYSRGDLMSPV